MKGARGWIVAGVLAVVIAALAYALAPHSDSPEHSSNSDAANGTSAALLFAQALGHQTSQMTDGFNLPPASSVMFVFSPTSPYTSGEADQVHAWVLNQGGVLIYASEQGDPELDRAFGVTRFGAGAVGGEYSAMPIADGVRTVTGGDGVNPLDPSPAEYHHGLTVGDFAPQAWLTTPWGAALLWLLIAVFFGLFLRGRRFGPVVPRPAEVARSDVEWSVAVGQLLRRSSARAVTLGMLANATERAVAARTGLPLQPRERFWNALWVRAPEIADQLARVENTLVASSSTERDLLNAARRLHEIAHPGPRK